MSVSLNEKIYKKLKNNYFPIILCILLVLFSSLIIFYYFFSKKDAFSQQPKYIVLLGDSVLNNSNYVKENESIEQMLNAQTETQITSLAQDGAVLQDVFAQIDKIPLEWNQPTTYIFLSIGGNDLLNHSLSEIYIHKLIEQYKLLIATIITRLPSANLYLLTLYYPTSAKYESYNEYISLWNKNVEELMPSSNIIYLQNIINQESDLVYQIEPSSNGGKKIAEAILQKIAN